MLSASERNRPAATAAAAMGAALAIIASACGPPSTIVGKSGSGDAGQGGQGGDSGAGGGAGGDAGSGSGGSGGASPDAGAPDWSSMGGSGGGCATAEIRASKPPVDVIVLVDTSASMQDESDNVQRNINQIGDFLNVTGIDYRLVLIANSASGGSRSFVVCPPPPLGGPSCGSNPPIYRKVPYEVGSNDALELILQLYDQTSPPLMWSDMLRPEALKAFVPVTDDEAQPVRSGDGDFPTGWTPILAEPLVQSFDAELLRRGNGTFGSAAQRRYIFYPIIGASEGNPGVMCGPGMQAPGIQYVELATLTKGTYFPLCLTDFGPVFKAIGEGVASAVACELVVPPPPPGQTLDPNKVNVVYTPSTGAGFKLPNDMSAPCDSGANGWQWSADMKKIHLCGDACARFKADLGAKVSIELGCATCGGTVGC